MMTAQEQWQSVGNFDRLLEIERISDEVWQLVDGWNPFAKDTIGKHLVNTVDSMGADIVEGNEQYHHQEALHFYHSARASVKRLVYWIRRARARLLMNKEQAQSLLAHAETLRLWIIDLIENRYQWMDQVQGEVEPFLA